MPSWARVLRAGVDAGRPSIILNLGWFRPEGPYCWIRSSMMPGYMSVVASKPMSSLMISRMLGVEDFLSHPVINAASRANPLNVMKMVLRFTVSSPRFVFIFNTPVLLHSFYLTVKKNRYSDRHYPLARLYD